MKHTITISIIICLFSWGCSSTTQGSEQNQAGISDSIDTEEPVLAEPIKESSKSIEQSFYPVYSKDTIMIFDSIGIGQDCHLLDLKGQSTLQTRTKEHHLFWTEMFEKKITLTEILEGGKFQLAFMGDEMKIEWIQKKVIDDTPHKKTIIADLQLDDYIEHFQRYGGSIAMHDEQIKGEPLIEMISYGAEELFIVSYKTESYPDYFVNGPSFLISNSDKKIYPLSGPCSDSESNVFILNGKLYIHTGSNCCDCGVVVEQLFEYDGATVELIIEDGSWST